MFLHLLHQSLNRLLSAAHLCAWNQITGLIQLQNGFDADGTSQKRTGFGDPSAAVKMLQVIYGCIQAGVRNCIPNPLCCLLECLSCFFHADCPLHQHSLRKSTDKGVDDGDGALGKSSLSSLAAIIALLQLPLTAEVNAR